MKRQQTVFYIISDVLSAILSWVALFLFRKGVLEGELTADLVLSDANLWLGMICVPIGWMSLYAIQGTYRNVLRRSRLKELVETLVATLIGCTVIFILLLVDDQVGEGYRERAPRFYPYASYLFLLLVHFVLTYVPRLLFTTRTVRRVHSRRLGFPTLFIGGGAKAMQTYLDLERQETYSGNFFVGYINVGEAQTDELSAVMPCLGGLADLRRLADEYALEEAIIAIEDSERNQLGTILTALDTSADLIIKITPDARDLIVGSIHQESIFHSPLIIINTRLMPEWEYSLKRLFDVVLSLVAMLLLSPVYLIIAIIVKCTSPGPVFYAQERIGYHGRPFKMHKFRSMYVDAEQAGPALSKDNDPRITPFGRFMRKVRLDEIPQFYNVFKGTMSLVGPRPERQYYIDQIVKRAPEYKLLQRVKPGITSWGQVRYGYASTVDEMVERLRYDLLYLDNMSLLTDLKILAYTVIIILQGRGK